MEKKKKLLDNNFVRMIIAVFILACCAGIGAGIAVIEEKSDPTEYVAQYFGRFLVRDFEGMFDYDDVGENAMDKDSFVALMTELKNQTNVGNYEFTKPVKKGDRYLVKVKYTDAQTDEKKTFDIYMYRTGGVINGYFAKWTVSVRDYIVDDYYIKIPSSMKVQFDGKDLEDSQICEADNAIKTSNGEIMIIKPDNPDSLKEFKTYKLTDVIMGSHYIYVYSDYMEMDTTVDIFESGKRAGFVEEQAHIKKANLEVMEKNSEEIIKEFYEAVRNRKSSTKKLLSYFADDKKLKKKIEKLSKSSQELVFWPGTRNIEDYSLMEINFSDLQHEAKYSGNGLYTIEYSYSYSYLSSTDTSVSTSYIFELEGDVKSVMTLTYKVDNGKLIVSDIKMDNKNKKKKDK